MKNHYFFYFLLITCCLRLIFFQINTHKEDQILETININQRQFDVVVSREAKRYFSKQEAILCLKDDLCVLGIFETWPRLELFDEINLYCTLKEPKNYSSFDYRKYLKKQGISYLCLYPKIKEIRHYQGNSWRYSLWRFKQIIVNKIDRNLEEPASGLLKATLLGLKTELNLDTKEALTRLGLAHLLAISGLHIALLVFGLKKFIYRVKLQKVSNLIIILFLIFYVFLIGLPVSAIRASLMISFIFLFKLKSIKKRFYWCFLIMLAIRPAWLEELSFQLSFCAIFAIIFLLPLLDGYFWQFLAKLIRYFKKKKIIDSKFRLSKIYNLRFTREIIKISLASLAVNIVIWPILVFNFQSFNYLFIIYNILILPALPFLLASGIIAIILPLSALGFIPVYLISEYIFFISKLEAGYFEASLSVDFLIIYYLILIYLVFLSKKIKNKKVFPCLLLLVCYNLFKYLHY